MGRNDEVLQLNQKAWFENVNSYAVIGKELARTKRYVDYEAILPGSGKKREVRWFFPDEEGQDSQHKRILVMLEKKSPSDHFRWPLAIMHADANGFGVLLYRRKGAALADVALGPQRPESLRTRIDIALEIVSRFSELHGSGWALEGFDGHELTVDIDSWRAIFDDCGSVVRQDAVEDSERFDVAGDSWTRFAKQSESPDNGHGRVPARKARDRCRRQRRGRTARSSRWPWRRA